MASKVLFVLGIFIFLAEALGSVSSTTIIHATNSKTLLTNGTAATRGSVTPEQCGGVGTFKALEVSGCSSNPCTIIPGSTIAEIKITLIPAMTSTFPDIILTTILSNSEVIVDRRNIDGGLQALIEKEVPIRNFQTDSRLSGDARVHLQVRNDMGADEICISIGVRFSNTGGGGTGAGNMNGFGFALIMIMSLLSFSFVHV